MIRTLQTNMTGGAVSADAKDRLSNTAAAPLTRPHVLGDLRANGWIIFAHR